MASRPTRRRRPLSKPPVYHGPRLDNPLSEVGRLRRKADRAGQRAAALKRRGLAGSAQTERARERAVAAQLQAAIAARDARRQRRRALRAAALRNLRDQTQSDIDRVLALLGGGDSTSTEHDNSGGVHGMNHKQLTGRTRWQAFLDWLSDLFGPGGDPSVPPPPPRGSRGRIDRTLPPPPPPPPVEPDPPASPPSRRRRRKAAPDDDTRPDPAPQNLDFDVPPAPPPPPPAASRWPVPVGEIHVEADDDWCICGHLASQCGHVAASTPADLNIGTLSPPPPMADSTQPTTL